LVKDSWVHFKLNSNESARTQFVSTLQNIKMVVSTWAKDRRNFNDQCIHQIENDLEVVYVKIHLGQGSQEDMDSWKSMEAQRHDLLLMEQENVWWHKIQALWLSAWD